MSIAVCIAKLLDEGKLDIERAQRFSAEYERLAQDYRARFGDTAGTQLATTDMLGRMKADASEARRTKMMQIQTQKSILQGLLDYVDGGGKAGRYFISLFDHHEAVPGVSNISNRHAAMRQLAWTRMGDFLLKFKRDLAGNLDEAAEIDIVRALHGEKVESASARELAEAFADTAEWLRLQFNVAGGHIGKMEGWALPQAHDSQMVARAGHDEWAAFIKPLLDRDRMLDSSGKPFTRAGMDDALKASWETIASEGLDKLEPGQVTGSKVANRRTDARFLVFKDADSWIAYQRRFGLGDAFNAITGHIDGMTKDIASMQILGPNPGLTVRWMSDLLRKGAAPTLDGGKSVPLEKAAAKASREGDRMWRYYRGELTQPDPTDRGVARFFAGLRNWNVASKLGSAYLSAVATDPVFASMTAKFNGLDATKVMGAYLRGFNPADKAHREAAAHAGLIFSEMTTRAERMWREDAAMKLNVHEVSRRLSDAVMRASLIAPHTVAMKQATGLGFMMDMAKTAGKSFDKLDPADQARFSRYGIDAADWDYIRATPLTDEGGYKLLRPGDVASREDGFEGPAQRAALKMFEMIDSETKFATPGESLRAQTMLALGGRGSFFQRGTIAGELANSATQFKTYSVIAIMTHMQRAIYGRGGIPRAAYGLLLPLFLTLGGSMVLQLKAVASGKDPEDMESPKFWGRAFVQGGGAGMAGDFISAGLGGQSRTGGTLLGFVSGPTLSNVVDPAISLTLGNAGEAMGGKKTNMASEATRLAESNLPGSSIWYAKLALSRLLLDQLDEAVDPKIHQRRRRMRQFAKEQGTQFYWEPGQTAPSRAPDLGNATGQ
jgi:hypothetical protein